MTATTSTGLSPRLSALLAYSGWWMTGLIFWALERRDLYVRRHAVQAVVVFGLVAVLMVACAGLAVVSLSFFPAVAAMFLYAVGFVWLAGLALWVFILWRIASGHDWYMPVGSRLTDRLMDGLPGETIRGEG